MRVNFGFYTDKQTPVAHVNIPITSDDLWTTAEDIANKYIRFKKKVDRYGYSTYIELCQEVPGLPDLIDQYLNPYLNNGTRYDPNGI